MSSARRVAALCLIVLLAACAKEEKKKQLPNIEVVGGRKQKTDDSERPNLLSFARGATVVSRTGEWGLDLSALSAIDSDPNTLWLTPPRNPLQSIVVSLAAPAHIKEVGLLTMKNPVAQAVSVESSMDGHRFTPLTTLKVRDTDEAQLWPVTADAQYLRFNIIESTQPPRESAFYSLQARGTETAPPPPRTIEGCWNVNGVSMLAFARRGGHLFGTMKKSGSEQLLDGASDGRVFRFTWTRGPEFGQMVFTVSPDDLHLNGLYWHEEPILLFVGDALFGMRDKCASPVAPSDLAIARRFLAAAHLYPLYSLTFRDDGSLDEEASADGLALIAKLWPELREPRLVAHEFRKGAPDANRAFAQKELAALRAALKRRGLDLKDEDVKAVGSDTPRQDPTDDVMRLMYSDVELEVAH